MVRSTSWGEWWRKFSVMLFLWFLAGIVATWLAGAVLRAGEAMFMVAVWVFALATVGFLINLGFLWQQRPPTKHEPATIRIQTWTAHRWHETSGMADMENLDSRELHEEPAESS